MIVRLVFCRKLNGKYWKLNVHPWIAGYWNQSLWNLCLVRKSGSTRSWAARVCDTFFVLGCCNGACHSRTYLSIVLEIWLWQRALYITPLPLSLFCSVSLRHLLTPQQRLVKHDMSSMRVILCFLGQRAHEKTFAKALLTSEGINDKLHVVSLPPACSHRTMSLAALSAIPPSSPTPKFRVSLQYPIQTHPLRNHNPAASSLNCPQLSPHQIASTA